MIGIATVLLSWGVVKLLDKRSSKIYKRGKY